MALRLTQPLTEMSTTNISWGWRWPVHSADNLTTSRAVCLEIWEPQTPGTLRACAGISVRRHAVAQLVEALRYKSEGREFHSRWCQWNFSLIHSFRPHNGPGVDSAFNRNEYQEYFLGVKAAGASAWQPYHLYVPSVLKSGSLNLLEPSGPVLACNGIALPFYFC